jgi:1-deoxyxylulose-5-phosphate synthase
MQYLTLGRSGLTISRIVLGAAQFGETVDVDRADAIVRAALNLGITTIDTADSYARGASEPIVGAVLASHPRDQLVLCTKVGLRVGDDDAAHAAGARPQGHDPMARWKSGIAPNDQGLSRKHLIAAVEASLRRLDTDYIDLYQVHRFDPSTPIVETLRALDDLVHSGKVRYLGCSGFAAWQMCTAVAESDHRGLERFESLQVRYSVVDRGAETETLPACIGTSVSALAFQVLAGGVLTGRVLPGAGSEPTPGTRASRPAVRARYWNDPIGRQAECLQRFAADAGRSPSEIAIGWVIGAPGIGGVIVGASQPDQLDAAARAADAPLLDDERRVLSDALVASTAVD